MTTLLSLEDKLRELFVLKRNKIKEQDPHLKWEDTCPVYKADKNRCTVVALAVVSGMSYAEAYEHMKTVGREHQGRLHPNKWTRALFGLKNKQCKILPYTLKNRISLRKFLKRHPKGVYFCSNNGHAFAIVDGVLMDYEGSKRTNIVRAIQLTNK